MSLPRVKKFFLDRSPFKRRPLGVHFFSAAILLIPVYYYLKKVALFGFGYGEWQSIFRSFSTAELFVSVGCLVCALGLFFVLKLGYFMFFALSLCYISFNLYLFFISSEVFNIEAVFFAFFGITAFIYFTSKDSSAPYTRGRGSGWRSEVRRSFQHMVSVDGIRRQIININSRGVLVRWKSADYKENDKVTTAITLDGERFVLSSVVVRVSPDELALAFEHDESKTRKDFYYRLKKIEETKSTENENL